MPQGELVYGDSTQAVLAVGKAGRKPPRLPFFQS